MKRPSSVARTITCSNSLGSLRRPFAVTATSKAEPVAFGGPPSEPPETCTFCSRSAAVTSPAVSPSAASRSGSSQMRAAYSRSPKICTSPTPSSRTSASRIRARA